MRLIALTAFTMVAFASNSILTRMAIEPGLIDPYSFALLRVLAGALFLWALVARRGSAGLPVRGKGRLLGAASLSIYMVGFSLAYISLDAGLGALIMFGVVQVSMFAYSACIGARPTRRQITGATLAFVGLLVALWPDGNSEGSIAGAVFMVIAGLGWAAYTLSGKNAQNPLAETGANFMISVPVMVVLAVFLAEHVTVWGVFLAVLCGAVTSGLGYALWYRVLPELQRSVAAVVQLSVPIIAIFAGAFILGETVTAAVVLSAVLVICGIALAVTKQSSPTGRS